MIHYLTESLEPGLDILPNPRPFALRRFGGKTLLQVFLSDFKENLKLCLLVDEQISSVMCHTVVETFYSQFQGAEGRTGY